MTLRPTGPGPGRPSVALQRRSDIINAYIEIVAEAPTISVAMKEVAERAGVARTAVSHFVGDRHDIHTAAIAELRLRYQTRIDTALGTHPTPQHYINVLFSTDWAVERTADDRAFDAFIATAATDLTARTAIRDTYRHFVDQLTSSIKRSGVPVADPGGVAYAVICLAEFNSTLLTLGNELTWNDRARAIATQLVAGHET